MGGTVLVRVWAFGGENELASSRLLRETRWMYCCGMGKGWELERGARRASLVLPVKCQAAYRITVTHSSQLLLHKKAKKKKRKETPPHQNALLPAQKPRTHEKPFHPPKNPPTIPGPGQTPSKPHPKPNTIPPATTFHVTPPRRAAAATAGEA